MWVHGARDSSSREARVRSLREPSSLGIIDVNGVGKPVDDPAPGEDAVIFFFFFFRVAYDVRKACDSRFRSAAEFEQVNHVSENAYVRFRRDEWRGKEDFGREISGSKDRSRSEKDRRRRGNSSESPTYARARVTRRFRGDSATITAGWNSHTLASDINAWRV